MSASRASRLAAFVAALALLAGICAPAPAAADRPTRTAQEPDSGWQSDACAFPVLVDIAGAGPGFVLVFAGEGDRAHFVAPGAKVTLTNLDTGASLRLTAAGPAHLDVAPDGSGAFVGVGTWVVEPADPVGGAPGIFALRGRLVGTVAGGEIAAWIFTGSSTDLCPALAA
jgi:hypothetical protein